MKKYAAALAPLALLAGLVAGAPSASAVDTGQCSPFPTHWPSPLPTILLPGLPPLGQLTCTVLSPVAPAPMPSLTGVRDHGHGKDRPHHHPHR